LGEGGGGERRIVVGGESRHLAERGGERHFVQEQLGGFAGADERAVPDLGGAETAGAGEEVGEQRDLVAAAGREGPGVVGHEIGRFGVTDQKDRHGVE
jgi:hypothetical protein